MPCIHVSTFLSYQSYTPVGGLTDMSAWLLLVGAIWGYFSCCLSRDHHPSQVIHMSSLRSCLFHPRVLNFSALSCTIHWAFSPAISSELYLLCCLSYNGNNFFLKVVTQHKLFLLKSYKWMPNARANLVIFISFLSFNFPLWVDGLLMYCVRTGVFKSDLWT